MTNRYETVHAWRSLKTGLGEEDVLDTYTTAEEAIDAGRRCGNVTRVHRKSADLSQVEEVIWAQEFDIEGELMKHDKQGTSDEQ